MPAKPLKTALGSLLIRKQYGYSDCELVEQITENPYYQYFIGLMGFSNEVPMFLRCWMSLGSVLTMKYWHRLMK